MNIYEAINGVMRDIGAIEKDKQNAQQNFNYRGIDDVMNALQPALVKHKVFIVPEVIQLNRAERTTDKGKTLLYSIATVKYRFYAEDGTFIEATVIGEGMDSADKSANKAMSIAFKYACFQVFCIPTEELIDPDGESYPPTKPKSETKKKSQKPSDVLNFDGADKADNKTLFVNALKIAGLTPSEGRNLIDDMYGDDITLSDLDKEQFIALLKELDKRMEKDGGAD